MTWRIIKIYSRVPFPLRAQLVPVRSSVIGMLLVVQLDMAIDSNKALVVTYYILSITALIVSIGIQSAPVALSSLRCLMAGLISD